MRRQRHCSSHAQHKQQCRAGSACLQGVLEQVHEVVEHCTHKVGEQAALGPPRLRCRGEAGGAGGVAPQLHQQRVDAAAQVEFVVLQQAVHGQ